MNTFALVDRNTKDRLKLAKDVDAVMESALEQRRLNGAVVMIARQGEVIYQRAAGWLDRETGRPMPMDAIFRLASMSKPIVSAAALKLVELGKLSLDDSVEKWIPEFAPTLADGRQAKITVRHLLTHTAGLSYNFFQPQDGPYWKAGVSNGLDQPGLSITENLSRLGAIPLFFEPGTSWLYSLATDVLGELLSRVANASLPTIVSEFITAPLGMRDSGFYIVDRTREAVPYTDGPVGPVRMVEEQIVPFGDGGGVSFALDRILNSDSYPSGGAGMAGTATDYLKFLEALRTGGNPILNTSSVKAMTSNQTGDFFIFTEGPGWGFGLGAAILQDPAVASSPQSPGTYRWGGAYGHSWFVDPKEGLTVVALTNTAFEGMAGKFTTHLRNAVYI